MNIKSGAASGSPALCPNPPQTKRQNYILIDRGGALEYYIKVFFTACFCINKCRPLIIEAQPITKAQGVSYAAAHI